MMALRSLSIVTALVVALTLAFTACSSKQSPAPAVDDPLAPAPAGGQMAQVFASLHSKYLSRASQGGIDLLFVGDSITEAWRDTGQLAWQNLTKSYRAENFGIRGDKVQNVAWRLRHGELDGIQPKLLVLLIGTNNLSPDGSDVEKISLGISRLVDFAREKVPTMRILLLGVLPRSQRADSRYRADIHALNAKLARLDDGTLVHFLDVGPRFLNEDGMMKNELTSGDYLHLSAQGYQVLADSLSGAIAKLSSGTRP